MISTVASQINGVSMVYLTGCSGADQRKHRNSASPTFVRGIHRWPVNSPHNEPVTRKMFPFDDVIMCHLVFHLSYVLSIHKSINLPIKPSFIHSYPCDDKYGTIRYIKTWLGKLWAGILSTWHTNAIACENMYIFRHRVIEILFGRTVNISHNTRVT